MKKPYAQRQAGRYKRKITIETYTISRDATGGVIYTWTPKFSTRAFIEQSSGEEYFAGYIMVGRVNYYMEMRYNPKFEINLKDRITFIDKHGIKHTVNVVEVNEQEQNGRFLRLLTYELYASELVKSPSQLAGVIGAPVSSTKPISTGGTPTQPLPVKTPIHVKTSNMDLGVSARDIIVTLDSALKNALTIADNINLNIQYRIGTAGNWIMPASVVSIPNELNKFKITIKTDAVANDVINWHYKYKTPVNGSDVTQPTNANGDILVDDVAHLVHIKAKPIINNKIPKVLSSTVEAGKTDEIRVIFDEDMKPNAQNGHKGISVNIGSDTNIKPIGITWIDAVTMVIKLPANKPIFKDDVVSWAYDDSIAGADLVALNDKELENQTYAVKNGSTTPKPVHYNGAYVFNEDFTQDLGASNPLTVSDGTMTYDTTEKAYKLQRDAGTGELHLSFGHAPKEFLQGFFEIEYKIIAHDASNSALYLKMIDDASAYYELFSTVAPHNRIILKLNGKVNLGVKDETGLFPINKKLKTRLCIYGNRPDEFHSAPIKVGNTYKWYQELYHDGNKIFTGNDGAVNWLKTYEMKLDEMDIYIYSIKIYNENEANSHLITTNPAP